MSSTDLGAPPLRLILTAIIIVVGLHLLTAIALVAIKTPELKIESEKNPSPIEIELVTLPTKAATSEVEVKEVTPIEEPAPQVIEPKPKTVPEVKPQPKKPVVPVVKEEKVKPKTTPVVPVKKPKAEERPKETLVEPKADANEQRKIIAAQAKAAQEAQARAAQEAQARAAQEAVAKAARDAQAAADAKAAREAAESAARAKAAKEAQAAAQAKAQAAAAASNTPVNFTASAANWASAPNFSFPDRAARRARSGDVLEVVLVLRVNKQGGIDSVRVAQSSGNTLLDKEAQRQVRSGTFRPFTKNGAPVVGNVTLPIAYKVP